MSLYLFGLEIEMRHYLYILQVLLSEGMFALFFRRKRCFLVRLFFSLSTFLLLSFIVPALLNPITRYNLIVVYLFSLPVFPICFSERFEDMFFCCTAAMRLQSRHKQGPERRQRKQICRTSSMIISPVMTKTIPVAEVGRIIWNSFVIVMW